LIVLDRNITYADQTRNITAGTVPVNAVETHAMTAATRQFQPSSRRNLVTSNAVLCYYCGKPGHIQRYCSARSFGRRDQARGGAPRS
jgi:hypothetical protein